MGTLNRLKWKPPRKGRKVEMGRRWTARTYFFTEFNEVDSRDYKSNLKMSINTIIYFGPRYLTQYFPFFFFVGNKTLILGSDSKI